ncbi:hypothetical protein BG015_010312, partial [Linnemannia schmuckeri]
EDVKSSIDRIGSRGGYVIENLVIMADRVNKVKNRIADLWESLLRWRSGVLGLFKDQDREVASD